MGLTANTVKVAVMKYFLYENNYLGAVTEGLQAADVLGIKRSFYTTEVEVKISRADLIGEINSMNHALKKISSIGNTSKLPKHHYYLENSVVNEQALPLFSGYAEKYKETVFKPNEFYFCVPQELDYMSEAYLDSVNSPYGMLVYMHAGYVALKRKAVKLHKEKVSTDNLVKMLTRASNENLTLRERLLKSA